jgi:hypothetical protein
MARYIFLAHQIKRMCSRHYRSRYTGPSSLPSLCVGRSSAVVVPESTRTTSEQCPVYLAPSKVPYRRPGIAGSVETIGSVGAVEVVATVPSSFRTELIKMQMIETSRNPANPVTRFEQYFRPIPPAPPCAERLPNLEPIRNPNPPCLGGGRFAPSAIPPTGGG